MAYVGCSLFTMVIVVRQRRHRVSAGRCVRSTCRWAGCTTIQLVPPRWARYLSWSLRVFTGGTGAATATGKWWVEMTWLDSSAAEANNKTRHQVRDSGRLRPRGNALMSAEGRSSSSHGGTNRRLTDVVVEGGRSKKRQARGGLAIPRQPPL